MKKELELHEDKTLADFASEREQTFDRPNALTHEDVWGGLKKTLDNPVSNRHDQSRTKN